MILRRSARIAAKEKKKETSQQADYVTTNEVVRSKNKSTGRSFLKESSKDAQEVYVEIITGKEKSDEHFESSPENSVVKENSEEPVQPSTETFGCDETLREDVSSQDDSADDPDRIITITFSAPKVEYKPRGITKIERTIRHNIHKTHLLTLLANGIVRNEWCNDQLIQAMACSLIERDMLALFDKALRPNDSSRGQLLITAIQELCDWWKKYFIISKPGICFREYHEFGTKGLIEDYEVLFPDVLTSIKSFRKSLKIGEGSRDTSAQLFVALLRSLGIPARLICSLQAVSFKFSRKDNSKKPEGNFGSDVKSTDQSDKDIKKKFNIDKYTLSSKNQSSGSKRKEREDDDYTPHQKKPTVYFAVHKKWLCVDPTRAFVNRPKAMEPSVTDKNNVMAYVVAFEQDGYIKDVTRRYTTQWGARTRKLRIPSTKDGYDWWDETLAYFARPYEREQDLCEDASLLSMEVSERMPTTISAFHNHPLYFETITPKLPVLGHIRGEPIYPRKNVKQEGQQPIKHVKSRIYTLAKRRAANMAELFNEEPLESGLYGEWQTEIYKPDPVVNGIVPKNNYGNVNLFKPSMCPPGGVHLPYNGMGKIAKKFGIDYGEAVVGFDFQSQRCVPVAKGVVVPEEHAEMLLEAWEEHIRNVEATNRAKKLKEIYDNWRKMIIGLQIRQRLKDDYGDRVEEDLSLENEDEGEDEFYHGETDEEKVEEDGPTDGQYVDAKDCGEVIVENVGDEGNCVGSQDENIDELFADFKECETETDLLMEDVDLNEGIINENDVDMIDTSSHIEDENFHVYTGITNEVLIDQECLNNYNDPFDTKGGFLLE
ncbi:11689_t:CDS:10 [Acaulospora colombiana]|uniref:11689_t:CDS:1 n=1 Tax=Acaulospora colombiana TaxID=27376 RepID=A0ACA9K9Q0_9GLOM|nr:11689_t:CDS:10 [Acaulospora colombiana]